MIFFYNKSKVIILIKRIQEFVKKALNLKKIFQKFEKYFHYFVIINNYYQKKMKKQRLKWIKFRKIIK